MASRKEQKEQARTERLAAERAEAQAAARSRNLRIAAGIGAAALVAVVVVVIAVAGGGGGGSDSSGASGPLPAAATEGALTTPAPWKPQNDGLSDRSAAMDLPPVGMETFHHHALLRIFVDGNKLPVPPFIGLTSTYAAPLHTHDGSGVVHLESSSPFPFTLGEFFAVWGVRFTSDQLGAYKDQGSKKLQVYVNGKSISKPVDYKIKQHDVIVVGYGKPGSFPKKVPPAFPVGL